MTSKEKLIQKFLTQPEALKYREIEKILIHLGFSSSQGKGSHIKFFHPNCPERIIFAIHDNDCKPLYKKRTLKILKNNKLF